MDKSVDREGKDLIAMLNLSSGPRLGVLAGALLALFTVPVALVSATGMTELQNCGGTKDTNIPLESFSLAAAKDLWLEFPALGRAPEIETETRPAQVIVFKNGYDFKAVGAVGLGPRPTNVDTVVCVIVAQGDRFLYTSVPRQGSRFGN